MTTYESMVAMFELLEERAQRPLPPMALPEEWAKIVNAALNRRRLVSYEVPPEKISKAVRKAALRRRGLR